MLSETAALYILNGPFSQMDYFYLIILTVTMSTFRLLNLYRISGSILLYVFILTQITTPTVESLYSFLSHDKPSEQVHLRPPANLTIYFTNSTSVTIGWDEPIVYVAWFPDISFEFEEDNNTYTGKFPNADNAPSLNGSDTQSTSGISNESDPSNVTAPVVKCLSYKQLRVLTNDTISIEIFNVTSNSITDFNDSDDENVVPYYQGCVLKYIVKWNEVGNTNTAMNQLEVPATQTVANISGLKTKTNYSISVSAVFEVKTLESAPVFMSTTTNEEPKICHCDWHGSITVDCNSKENTSNCYCKPGYYGQYCERCAPGFYRTTHFHPCHRCPCHPPSALIPSCSLIEGFLQCDKCQKGYTGLLCHQCDIGFYRYGKMCIPCRCNGNAMKNVTNMCHPITGSCTKCMYNTTGFNCERCQDGYVGDPITAKNCTLKKDLNLAFPNTNVSSTSIVGIILGVIILGAFLVAGVILIRRYRLKDRKWAFWSVEMRQDDLCQLDDENDDTFYGTKTKSSTKYVKLHEDI